MLGWEYPPHISGGLGTACEGLTTGLARLGVQVDFVVPRLYGDEPGSHMRLWDASTVEARLPEPSAGAALPEGPAAPEALAVASPRARPAPRTAVVRHAILTHLRPYLGPVSRSMPLWEWREVGRGRRAAPPRAVRKAPPPRTASGAPTRPRHYGGDLFEEVARFARKVLALGQGLDCDLIHAHDWMTYPAGVALSEATGIPLAVHVHSLERDRCGEHGNPGIRGIEEAGLQTAHQVIAVSYYTRDLVHREYGIPLEKIEVVHNGVYTHQELESSRQQEKAWGSKVVLFLGRITFQKGPDYFVEAAARVVSHVPDARFVMAGTGDMLPRIRARVAELGLEGHFQFPGFLRGEEVERMLALADLYVMPSVSEPFGIAPLEAMRSDVPVVISRQSGVSEVLKHALKVDFWDIDRMADLMINALIHRELAEDMVAMAREEIRLLHWDAAAEKCLRIYRRMAED